MSDLEDIIRAIVRDEVARLAKPANDECEAVASTPSEWSVDYYGTLPSRPDRGGFVYFLLHPQPTPHIKIGYTKDLAGRLSNAQTGTPYRLRYVAYFWAEEPGVVESDLHQRFLADCVRGEWHRLTADLAETVNLVRQEMRNGIARALGRVSGA